MAAIEIMPRTQRGKLHPSRKNITSNIARSMITATQWAMAANTEPNFLQHMLKTGPIQQAMPKKTAATPALTPIGARATMPTRINELVGWGG